MPTHPAPPATSAQTVPPWSTRSAARKPGRDVPVVIGGIEASLRRIAHYDYWQDKVRRSVLVDSKADLLLYGNAERAIIEVAHRLAARQPIETLTDIRGTAYMVRTAPELAPQGWMEIDSTEVDRPGRIDEHINPYLTTAEAAESVGESCVKEQGQEVVPPANVVAMPVSRKTGAVKMPARENTGDSPAVV